ncbi:MAG: hypothetical protein GY760_14695 [Deltaproteobacteria bacterium]|nr:hypothetical protein [Deltaproteobacteria bacterium]
MKYGNIFYLALVIFIFVATSLFAEYYSFVDSKGVKHYTDNISEVPVDQRPNLNIYSSIKTPEKIESKNLITLDSLVIRRDTLDTEYGDLMKKKELLMGQKLSIGEKEYNELATQLNTEINQYKKRKLAYNKLVDQYNNQVNASEEKK